MIENIFFVFDVIYKLIKLQFCILFSLIIGLFIFSVGPTLYATSAIINEITRSENTSVVRSYFNYIKVDLLKNSLFGVLCIAFISSSLLFAYNIRYFFSSSMFSIVANIYYLIVLITVIIMFIYFSIIRDYKLTVLQAIRQSFKITIKVPFVTLFIVLWTIGCSIIFSTIFGLYIVLGLAIYLGGVFTIINKFLYENEEAVKR